jgi:hypothetical protein
VNVEPVHWFLPNYQPTFQRFDCNASNTLILTPDPNISENFSLIPRENPPVAANTYDHSLSTHAPIRLNSEFNPSTL